MTTLPSIDLLSEDNGKSFFRSVRVKTGGKEVATPCRALEPRRASLLPRFDPKPFPIVEHFVELGQSGIDRLQSGSRDLGAFESRLRSLDRAGISEAARVCFAQFKPEKPGRWPDKDGLELLTDLTHSNSDIVPVPSVAAAIGLDKLQGLVDHAKLSMKLIERLNTKPLMGWVPIAMPRAGIPKLLDLYLNGEVRAFCLDFGGRIPTHLQVRPVLAHLAERRVLADSLIYALNPRPGKFIKNAKEIPARDFFVHGYGVDVLGGSHLRAFVPQSEGGRESLSAEVARRAANRKRVFSPATYGYHRVDSRAEAERILPDLTSIAPSAVFDHPTRSIEKAVSMDCQASEAGQIRRRLRELGRRESILAYVGAKRLAADAIPTFRRHPTLD